MSPRSLKGALEINHIGYIGDYDRVGVESVFERFLGKYRRMGDIRRLTVSVKAHMTAGSRKKYSMKSAMYTDGEVVRASASGWDEQDVARSLTVAMMRQMMKRKGKMRAARKSRKTKMSTKRFY